MAVNIEMPKLSDTMTEGTLLKWHKKVGDRVEIGDIIAEVETDKATMEMEAFDDGVLTAINIPEGGKATIGSVLAVLDGNDAISAPAAESAPASAGIQVAAVATAAVAQVVAAAAPVVHAAGERIKSSPLARKVAAALNVDLNQIAGSGPGGRIVRQDVESASQSPAAAATKAAPSSALASAAAALAAASKTRATTPAPARAAAILPVAVFFPISQNALLPPPFIRSKCFSNPDRLSA